MTHVLSALQDKTTFSAVGLMSGTSMDGIDAALVSIDANPDGPTVMLREFITVPYPDALQNSLADVATGDGIGAEGIATLHTGVGVAFAGAFFELCRRAGVDAGKIDFIGSHGQTVAHVPPSRTGEGPISGTLQLGPPAMVAALTGVTTVGDFRVGDVALGGQGAPLAPLADWLLRRSATTSRIILNIGGIANLTWLPRGGRREDVVAFDTGPGNMILDALYRVLFPDSNGFDTGGAHARAGRVHDGVLNEALGHPYFSVEPPKSAGHREFGAPFAWQFHAMCQANGLAADDSLATAAALTITTIADAVDRFLPEEGADEVFVTGGGVHNKAVMEGIQKRFPSLDLRPIDELGIPADAKEAVDFALLARETLFGRPGALSGVTGAAYDLVLGTIAPGTVAPGGPA